MTTTQFNGVGYSNQPIQDNVPFITQYTIPQQFLYNSLLSIAQNTTTTSNLNGFLNQYNANNPLPQDIDSFSSAFVSTYNLAPVYGGTTNAVQFVKNAIISANESAIQTNLSGGQGADYTPLINPIGNQVVQQTTFNQDMATRSFNDFLKTFTYSSDNAGNPVNVSSSAFQTSWGRYYVTVADTATSYLNVFTAFFNNGTQTSGLTDFETALGSYIVNIMYPPGGSSAAFLPSHNYGNWLTQMVTAYEKAIHGTASTSQTTIGPSVEGARILNVIFDLVVKMIGTLQIVTAAQSDRLKFLTSWQQAYTNLEASIRSFVKSGPEWIQGDDDSRNQLNQANQTYTQEIQSRITVVNDDSKQLQTNINQSNDAVSQQTSLGTAIIQQLSSLLSAIYGASG